MASNDHRSETCYTIYRGRVDTPTIYHSWSQVHPRVTGYESPDIEKFATIEQARREMQARNIRHFEEAMDVVMKGEKPGPRKSKYYAVAGGRRTGVFTSWRDANAVVRGTCGCHEVFATREEAERFIAAWKEAFADTWKRQVRIALDSGWSPRDMKMDTGFFMGKDCDGLPMLENLSIADGL